MLLEPTRVIRPSLLRLGVCAVDVFVIPVPVSTESRPVFVTKGVAPGPTLRPGNGDVRVPTPVYEIVLSNGVAPSAITMLFWPVIDLTPVLKRSVMARGLN
jgi:hypothetical protein